MGRQSKQRAPKRATADTGKFPFAACSIDVPAYLASSRTNPTTQDRCGGAPACPVREAIPLVRVASDAQWGEVVVLGPQLWRSVGPKRTIPPPGDRPA